MFPGRLFLLNDGILAELEKRGLGKELVAALRTMRNRRFRTGNELLEQLGAVTRAPLSQGDGGLILKLSRQGFLRLERIIPNRGMREWSEALIFALVVAAIVRTFLFAPFKIPSGSMIPTIEIGDHIFATMFSYGVPVPLSDQKLLAQKIERGDIVIFPYPLDPEVDYIKRVVAVEEDSLEVKDGHVYINGEAQDEPFAFFDPVILAMIKKNGSQPQSFGPVKIPPGKLFMMGDNRFNSSDSRVWGFVDANTVKGKGQIIYWSHDPNEGLLGGYRMERIGRQLR